MSNAFRQIVQSRLGGKVERCHAVPHQGSYSNAAHMWGVAMLMHYLWPEDFPRLAIHCIAHDVPEGWVGDVPATVTNHCNTVREALAVMEHAICEDLGLPNEAELEPEDHAKLKACDRLELYLWCVEQLTLGNVYAAEPIKELDRLWEEHPLPSPADELWSKLRDTPAIPRQAGVVKELMNRGI